MWFFLATVQNETTKLRNTFLSCPMSCESFLALMESKMVLRLFMVPVAAFNHQQYLQCSTCGYSRPYEDKDLMDS